MYIFTKDDKFVSLDNSSGGYPYLTADFLKVKIWGSKELALEYKKHFKTEKWQLRKLHGLSFSLPLEY